MKRKLTHVFKPFPKKSKKEESMSNQTIHSTLLTCLIVIVPKDLIHLIYHYAKNKWDRAKELHVVKQYHLPFGGRGAVASSMYALPNQHMVFSLCDTGIHFPIWKMNTASACEKVGELKCKADRLFIRSTFLFAFLDGKCKKYNLMQVKDSDTPYVEFDVPFQGDRLWQLQPTERYIFAIGHEPFVLDHNIPTRTYTVMRYDYIQKKTHSFQLTYPATSRVKFCLTEQGTMSVMENCVSIRCYHLLSGDAQIGPDLLVPVSYGFHLLTDFKVALLSVKTLQVYDVRKQQLLWSRPVPYENNGIIQDFSDPSVFIVTNSHPGQLHIYEMESGTLLQMWNIPTTQANGFNWTHDSFKEETRLFVAFRRQLLVLVPGEGGRASPSREGREGFALPGVK